MKKHTYTIAKKSALLVLCAIIVLLSGCSDSGGEGSAEKKQVDEGAAKKYVDLLTSDKSEYYMAVTTKQETAGSEDVFQDTQAIAQDGDKKFFSSDANQVMQYYLDGYLYYFQTSSMSYYKMKQTGQVDDITDAYAPRNGYKKTEKRKFEGEECSCDIYEKEVTEEGIALTNTTEYYVGGGGDLVGVVSEQKNTASGRMVSRVTMIVTDFQEKVPAGTFELPDGYTEVRSGS